jgi:hypothetical protein
MSTRLIPWHHKLETSNFKLVLATQASRKQLSLPMPSLQISTMRRITAFALLITFFACTVKPTEQSTTIQTDSLQEAVTVREEGDTSIYVGFIRSFPETKEYYINLYYKGDPVDDKVWRPFLDSVVYQDEEVKRQRLPLVEARKLLDIANLDTLWLYTRNHATDELVILSRVEWYDGVIDGGFVAVYKPNLLPFRAPYYGISADKNSYTRIPKFSALEIFDNALSMKVASHLQIDTAGYKFTHYHLEPSQAIYTSVVSGEKTFVTETLSGTVTKVMENDDSELILDLLPLPILVNNKPALLISSGLSESDVMWDYLATWNGTTYVESARSRLGQ